MKDHSILGSPYLDLKMLHGPEVHSLNPADVVLYCGRKKCCHLKFDSEC